MSKLLSICIVGERGLVSRELTDRLRKDGRYTVEVISTESACCQPAPAILFSVDLVVLCTQEFSSPEVVSNLPDTVRILDVSPAFRLDAKWVYGLPELPDAPARIAAASRVANPGCFATSAILALEPLTRAGLLDPAMPVYLDGAGGYSTGGSAMMERAVAGELPSECVFSLTREHRHVPEIKQVSGLLGPVMLTPKIANAATGIRMQVPFFGIAAADALRVYQDAYVGTTVVVESSGPSKVAVDDHSGKSGARLRVYEMPGGCLTVCTLDNMLKGAIDTAQVNIGLMLGPNAYAATA